MHPDCRGWEARQESRSAIQLIASRKAETAEALHAKHITRREPEMENEQRSEQVGDFVTIAYDRGIAEVTFDRGDALNAFSIQAMTELKKAAEILASDTKSSAVVLTGGKVFSAGADLADPAMRERDSMTLLEQREAVRLGPDLCQAWADLEQITIAAIERFCIGGGLAIAVSCDHRVASSSAHFRLPEIPLGMNMSWRSIPRIVSLIGPSRAKELVILGQKVDADKAIQWGLIDRLAEPGLAISQARELARSYSALPPLPARMAKEAINASAQPLGYATSYMDRDQFLLARRTGDHEEAVRSFLEKRDADFNGD